MVEETLSEFICSRKKPEGVVHHSDQGSQYTSIEFGKCCKEMGVKSSIGSVDCTYDNAMVETFFASLECELIDRQTWKAKADARLAIFILIESCHIPVQQYGVIQAQGIYHQLILKGE